MTAPQTITDVVANGLCTGCGLCASLVPGIEMGLNIRGNMRPLLREAPSDEEQRTIMSACPGATIERAPTQTGHGVDDDACWGPIRTMHRSWASDEAIRFHGAGGGTLTALSRYLLESGEVTAVLSVRADQDKPWLTTHQVSRSASDLEAAAQSRYGPAAPLVPIRQLLDAGEVFAVVAKPCDISAVRALGRSDARVAEQIPYLLTIFCGGVHNAHIPRAIIRHHGVEENDVAQFRYRGDGWPGALRVRTTDGVNHDMTYQGAWADRPWTYDLQFRCKICPDAVGEVADVSVPDGWVLRDGRPIHEEAPGTNLAIARTQRGASLLARAREAGYLELAPMGYGDLEPMHHNHVDRRRGAAGQFLALALMRRMRPRVSRVRWMRALGHGGVRRAVKQFLGTVRRVRNRENREPLI